MRVPGNALAGTGQPQSSTIVSKPCRRTSATRLEGIGSAMRPLAAARGNSNVVVTTPIAREIPGFIWAVARQLEPQTTD
jgi:hypothetical protein